MPAQAVSWFKISIDLEEALTCDVPRHGTLARLLREASLVIWYVASIAKNEDIEAVVCCFRICVVTPVQFVISFFYLPAILDLIDKFPGDVHLTEVLTALLMITQMFIRLNF